MEKNLIEKLNQTRTIRILRVIMPIVAVISAIIFVPWNAAFLWLSPLSNTIQAELDRAVANEFTGIIVYVDQPEAASALYTAGWNNRSKQIPTDPQVLFKIGSISKLYVAAATVMLVDDGILSLDDLLADHLPDLVGRVEYADQITLRMLLQHRSGIPNFVDHPDYPWFETLPNLDAYLAFVIDQPADFLPDKRYAYSNTNYLLIGNILDNVLGYSHHQYIASEILEPLGLTDTYSLLSAVDMEDVASGYHYAVEPDLIELDHIAPSGSMIASAQDVGVFLRSLNDGSLFSAQEQAIYSEVYKYSHTGWLPGYQSIAHYDESTDTVFVLFANSTGGDTEMLIHILYNRIKRIANR